MRARGPDGAGEWISPRGDVGLAHRRLAVIDLSPLAGQPMSRQEGRLHIVYNGEVYNFREIRSRLVQEGAAFRTSSDTEVILALYEREGVEAFGQLRGMFALAIWDDVKRRLLLARDPFGIKPLYWHVDRQTVRFASQVKALEAGGAVSRRVDPAGLVGFLLWGSVPEPFTIRQGVRALPAGHVMVVEEGRVGEPTPYRSPISWWVGETAQPSAPTTSRTRRGDIGGDSVLRGAGIAVEESVRAHLVADVPVAVFLSAGLDSAIVAAVAARILPEPPVTFTVRFDELLGTRADEGPLAAQTARRLGTRHVECTVGRGEFLDLWPRAVAAMDQPSIDGFNTFVIAALAAAHGLKVVLSGLGGDELFGSYPSFRQVSRWARLARLARPLAPMWPVLARALAPSTPKLAGFLRYGRSLPGAYFLRRAVFLPEELPALLGEEAAREGLAPCDPLVALAPLAAGCDAWTAVHRLESGQYLRNQLLRDADWAAMAHSLELRVPFVDAWLESRLAGMGFEPARSQGKAALARVLVPELPEAVLRRRKTGFTIPAMRWLDPDGKRGSLGMDSRRLALRVLAEFGVELDASRSAA